MVNVDDACPNDFQWPVSLHSEKGKVSFKDFDALLHYLRLNHVWLRVPKSIALQTIFMHIPTSRDKYVQDTTAYRIEWL